VKSLNRNFSFSLFTKLLTTKHRSTNGIVIGQELYHNLSDVEDYIMKEVGKYGQYSIYSVASKQERKILNPFRRTSNLIH